MPQSGLYALWIEAEEWLPGSWVADDSNTDVIATFADGRRWVASFFTYANIGTLTQKNRQTGECLSGAYFWASNMMLIDQVSRSHIEAVIQYPTECATRCPFTQGIRPRSVELLFGPGRQ